MFVLHRFFYGTSRFTYIVIRFVTKVVLEDSVDGGLQEEWVVEGSQSDIVNFIPEKCCNSKKNKYKWTECNVLTDKGV